jgi:hypothetical protein
MTKLDVCDLKHDIKNSDVDKDNCFLSCRDQHYLHMILLGLARGLACATSEPQEVEAERMKQATRPAAYIPEFWTVKSPKRQQMALYALHAVRALRTNQPSSPICAERPFSLQ